MFRGLDAPAKGLPYLLNALERIKYGKAAVYLLIVNGSGFFNSLKGRFAMKEFNIITDSKAMAGLYQAADIFLAPSLQETFGMMVVEAMACGLPCVVTKDTPLTEITQAPEAALAVQKRNPGQLADAIDQLVDNGEMRIRLGRRGRELAEELYDFKIYAKKMRELYVKAHERKKVFN
jgi:glycosyltransferase involved in cell wall biosynthesis